MEVATQVAGGEREVLVERIGRVGRFGQVVRGFIDLVVACIFGAHGFRAVFLD